MGRPRDVDVDVDIFYFLVAPEDSVLLEFIRSVLFQRGYPWFISILIFCATSENGVLV